LKRANSCSQDVFELLEGTIAGVKEHRKNGLPEMLDALAKAKKGPEGPEKQENMEHFAQMRGDGFPTGIDAIVSALEKAKLVDLDGDGPVVAGGLEKIPVIVERCAKDVASREAMPDSVRKRYRDAERNRRVAEEKYYDVAADQARKVAIELYTGQEIGGTNVSFFCSTVNRRFREVSSVGELTEEALETAAKEKLGEVSVLPAAAGRPALAAGFRVEGHPGASGEDAGAGPRADHAGGGTGGLRGEHWEVRFDTRLCVVQRGGDLAGTHIGDADGGVRPRALPSASETSKADWRSFDDGGGA
jgi:hypothetical protein